MKKYAVVIVVLASLPTATIGQQYDLETHDMLADYCQLQSNVTRFVIPNKIQNKMSDEDIKDLIIQQLKNTNYRIWLPLALRDTDVLLNFLENMKPADRVFAKKNLYEWNKSISTMQYQECLSKLP